MIETNYLSQLAWNPQLEVLVMLLCGAGMGSLVTWLVARSNLQRREAQWESRATLARSKFEHELDRQEAVYEEKLRTLEAAQNQMTQSFKSLSADALKASHETFVSMAKETLAKEREIEKGDLDRRRQEIGEMVKPVRDSLDKVDRKINDLEKAREGAYRELRQQVTSMAETQTNLQKETGNLVRALRRPVGRGQWGELQLRRVVEMAGMQEHCDFNCQTTTTNDEGSRLRPDLIVNLPGGKSIVVDAKTPMEAYLNAIEAREQGDDVAARDALRQHAAQLRNHVRELSKKSYQNQFETSPEFVVLFLPSESFFSDALSQDPALIESGVNEGVILATPTTLIALLRAVSYGWRQETLAENAQVICSLGHEMYERISKMGEHFAKVGKSLTATVNSYNNAVGTLESRVLVSARKFRELGAAPEKADDLESPLQVESISRELQSDELRASAAETEESAESEEKKKPKAKQRLARPSKVAQRDDQTAMLPFEDLPESVN